MITDKISKFMLDEDQARPLTAHKVFTTMFTKACARQSAYRYHAFKPEPKEARTLMNFELGNLVEKMVLEKAKKAGCEIKENNAWLTVKRGDIHVTCKPDGIYNDSGKLYNIEIKKMSEYSYKSFIKNGLDDTWGYLTQANMECEAQIQANNFVQGTCFIVVNGNTGHFQEEIINYDVHYVDAVFKRIGKVFDSTIDNLPKRFYNPVVRGNKEYLDVQCSYCDYKKYCYPEFEIQFTKTGFPMFVK